MEFMSLHMFEQETIDCRHTTSNTAFVQAEASGSFPYNVELNTQPYFTQKYHAVRPSRQVRRVQ